MKVREVVVSNIKASAKDGILIFEVILKFLIKDLAKDGLTFLQKILL